MKFFSKVDSVFLISVIALLFFGLFIFASAALGVLSSNELKFYSVIENQLVYSLVIGSIALVIGTAIPFKLYEKYAVWFFLASFFVTLLVFVPGIQMYHGGAHRWIHIGAFSLQPSEFLKLGAIILVSMWCAKYAYVFKSPYFGFFPYLIASGAVALVMLLQPDFGTFLIIISGMFASFFIGGATKKHIGLLLVTALIGFVLLISVRPYMMDRVKTFFNSKQDFQGSSWQLNQSLIAVGSGGLLGRGYGQSVQKFNYLPEPIGDSVFAVLGEELGFIGVGILFSLYGIVIVRALRIALFSEDQFGRLLVVGITTLIIAQVVLNVGSMIGILPLTGVPLPFVSHGGTALILLLFEIGIILNVSKQSRTYL